MALKLRPKRSTKGAETRHNCILLVDDEEPSRNATRMALRHLGYEVVVAENARDALELFDPERHALVITDNRMPGQSGAELAAELRRRSRATPIVMHTGFAPPRHPPVDRVLEKPVELDLLKDVLSSLLSR